MNYSEISAICAYCDPPRNVGTLFNEVIIPPSQFFCLFYLNDEDVFTIYFEGYHYQSFDYEALVEFVKQKAKSLSTFDVIPS